MFRDVDPREADLQQSKERTKRQRIGDMRIARLDACFVLDPPDPEGYKGCKWSPDGTCLLSSKDRVLNIYEPQGPRLNAVVTTAEAEPIYDYAWFPRMDSTNPATCCFASLSRSTPVHLWDAYESRRLRASYTLESEFKEPVWGLSVGMNDSKVFCGMKSAIYSWNIERPGTPLERLKTNPTKASNGLTGLVSCFAFDPNDSNRYAIGTYSGYVGIFSPMSRAPVFRVRAQKSGVTQVKYSSCGRFLWAGGRRSRELFCWDLRAGRGDKDHYWCIPRECRSNIHLDFDIVPCGDSPGGAMILSGSTSHCSVECHVFKGGEVKKMQMLSSSCPSEEIKPVELRGLEEVVSRQCIVNGVSVNPSTGQVALSTGERTPPVCIMQLDSDDDDDKDVVSKGNEMTNHSSGRSGGLFTFSFEGEVKAEW